VLAEHDPDSGVRATACQYLAQAAAPDDAATYAVLCRIVAHDESKDVRAEIARHLRQDAPRDVTRGLKGWMRDAASPSLASRSADFDVQCAVVEALFTTSKGPGEFLHRMRDEPVQRVEFALRLLREKHVAVAWSDVGKRIAHRSFPVLLELAQIFADRPEAPPVSFWLRCATHMKEIHPLREAVRVRVMEAITSACHTASPDAVQGAEDSDLLHHALTVLADLLPRVAHASYLELTKAGAIPHASSRPSESGFARLWVAMIRLSPNPGLYELRPRHK
jgi:hypothetical protein